LILAIKIRQFNNIGLWKKNVKVAERFSDPDTEIKGIALQNVRGDVVLGG